MGSVSDPVRQALFDQVEVHVRPLALSMGMDIDDPDQRLRFVECLLVWVEEVHEQVRRELPEDLDPGQPF